jgi:hypothetical protein
MNKTVSVNKIVCNELYTDYMLLIKWREKANNWNRGGVC